VTDWFEDLLYDQPAKWIRADLEFGPYKNQITHPRADPTSLCDVAAESKKRKSSLTTVITSWNILHGQQIPPNPQFAPNTPQKAKQLLTSAGETIAKISGKSLQQKNFVIALQEVDFNQPRTNFLNQSKLIAHGLSGVNKSQWFFVPTLVGTPGQRWRKVKPVQYFTNSTKNLSELNNENNLRESAYGIAMITNVKVNAIHLKKLGRSLLGLPLLFPGSGSENERAGAKKSKNQPTKSQNRPRLIYVKDEPRIAMALELANGLTVINTHLSFVPFVNLFQLAKISRWAKKLPGEKILVGDLNLPANLPSKLSSWISLVNQKTYPSWKPGIQFDYIMARKSRFKNVKTKSGQQLNLQQLQISDHIPISVELTLN